MGHKKSECIERPRKVLAKFTETEIKPDDIIVNPTLTYDAKRDVWNGYNPNDYMEKIKEHELLEEERR